MSTNDQKETRAGGVVRAVTAILIFLAFIAVIGYSFWPQIQSSLQSSREQPQETKETTFISGNFEVHDSSTASPSLVRGMLTTLNAQFEAVSKYLDKRPDGPLPIFIQDGEGIAGDTGEGLTILHDHGVLDTTASTFFLVFAIEGNTFDQDLNIFLEGGFASYVSEEVETESQLFGQSADNWVALFREKGAFKPLEDVLKSGLPQDEGDTADFLLALLEGGSFMRWVVDNYGIDSARELMAGGDLESITGLPVAETEERWMQSLDEKELFPQDCRRAVRGESIFDELCVKLDETYP